MNKNSKIYIAGHKGLVGSAILKKLNDKGYNNIVFKEHKELDLEDHRSVKDYFDKEKPEYVFLAAAKVGGINANSVYRADFIYHNIVIQNNVIYESWKNNVIKLLFLGSTCIYPKEAPQPINEDSLLTGSLEYTNEPYAIAKIAGIKLCESFNIQYGTNFLSVMPTNLYGPNDNFDLEKSHVLPALLRKIHLAKLLVDQKYKEILKDIGCGSYDQAFSYLKKNGITKHCVEVWGSGKPRREFLWSEDMADACIYIMERFDFKDVIKRSEEIRNSHINIGTGTDISIYDLAQLIKYIVGFKGELVFNENKPDGTIRKLTDVSKINRLGWKHTTELEDGIKKLYSWYLSRDR